MTELALPPTIAAAQAATLRSPFFAGASILMLLLVLAGFAPTFYLSAYFPSARPVPAYVYWHGAVMTAWYVLFVVQTRLVAAHRADLHRRLGVAGCVLAAAVLATGFYVNRNLAPRLAALGVQLPPATEQLVTRVVLMGLFGLAIFTVLIAAAVLLRRRRAAHSRLMFLAVLATIPAAVGPPRWLDARGWRHCSRRGWGLAAPSPWWRWARSRCTTGSRSGACTRSRCGVDWC